MNRKLGLLVFLILFLIISTFTIIASGVNLEKPLSQVNSCSNYPILEPGNIILIEDTDFEQIEENDTVIFQPDESETQSQVPVAHQVVEKHENYLETQGESNPRQFDFEKNITEDQVLGTAKIVLPITSDHSCP